MLKDAFAYSRLGLSVLPLNINKRPFRGFKWEEFQSRRATRAEMRRWWTDWPNANVGIVTGKVSGLAVVDCDSADGEQRFLTIAGETFLAPMVETPRGGKHYYCRFTDGLRNNAGAIPHVDLRAEGGYVVAPPSIVGGRQYRWIKTLAQVGLPPFPPRYAEIVKSAPTSPARTIEALPAEWFSYGRRDEDMFTVAWHLVKADMPREKAEEILKFLASKCDPPFSPKERDAKIQSAYDRALRKERNLSMELRNIVATTDGTFSLPDCYNLLQVTASTDRLAVRSALQRMKEEGEIERAGTRDGYYRRVVRDLLRVDWKNAPMIEFPIKLPLGIGDMVSVYPGNILTVAGVQNSGKTGLLLDVAKKNQDNMEVDYYTSEMGASELHVRLALHEDIKMDAWTMNVWERSSNFHDVIRPNVLSLVDFLEVRNEFWQVADRIAEIQEKLDEGVAFIAIQKTPGQELGRGGSFGTERPRLYLSLDNGRVKLVKCKNWKPGLLDNPNGKVRDFKLVKGWKFIPEGDWREDIPRDATKKDWFK